MEPSFVVNPYVQASAPSSHKIREILNREEASYEAWRKTRKPVRLPYASKKLNNQLKSLGVARDSNQSKTSSTVRSTPNSVDSTTEARSDVAGQNRTQSQPSVRAGTIVSATITKRHGMSIAEDLPRSMETLPSITGVDVHQKPAQAPDLTSKLAGDIMPRKGFRRRFHQYLYDFHSRQVFSFARNEVEELEDAIKRVGDSIKETKSVSGESYSSDTDCFSTRSIEVGLQNQQSDCMLNGLGFLSDADYDAIFKVDWKSSDAEKTVRDAVDRKRIREILRRSYRMLLWFFRYYAGNAAHALASERRVSTGAITAIGEGLFEIPSRVRLLEDLNVQCVDAAKFSVTDTPLQREGLIDFLLNVARMMCTHSPNPNRLRMVISEGIEMSDAVKTLVHDHFGVFAQIQDVDHFRTLFLRKTEAFAKSFRISNGSAPRRLHAIIEMHMTNLTSFFDELVIAGALTRSGAINDRGKGPQRPRGKGLVCTQFLKTLRAVNLITSRGGPAATSSNTSSTGDPSGGPAGVDEVRAVRIFLSCLPMSTVDESGDQDAANSGTAKIEPRELTLSQFIEALLRVAFTWKELQICRGGFDVCPNQMTSDWCQCIPASANYAFDVFEDATEEIFARIHAYRLKRANHRTSMRLKSMKMKSHHSLHSLVALATGQKAPTRLLPVDGKSMNIDPED
ncbi:hypothetical protein ON010_g2114 [Phytophthora cinnamomi]|nr:hypothetical protein ON010_g2114 [Phytophthora cinnamomi]